MYYVTLNDDLFIKQVYETDINGIDILETGIPLPELEKYELIWSRAIQGKIIKYKGSILGG